MRKLFYLLFLISFLLGSCENRKETPLYIAKVNNNYLSLDDLKGRFDTNTIKSKTKVREYINLWVYRNLLYQEAEEKGITGSAEFNELLTEARKSIAVNLLLEKEIYSKELDVSESEINTYYNSHKDEFFLGSDIISIYYIGFDNLASAQEFRKKVGESGWRNAIESLKKNNPAVKIFMHEDSSFFKQSEISPPDLWKTAVNLNQNQVSEPQRTIEGYVVLKLNSYQKAGEYGDINYAREEIKERIKIEKRKKMYSDYLGELQKKYHPEMTEESINK